MMSTSFLNRPEAHNLRNYNLEVVHLCCLHDFNPDDYRTQHLSFSGEYAQPGHDAPIRRYVMDPRWCRECAEWRRQAITASFEARLSMSCPTDREEAEKFVVQRQFLKGVRDGRIYAIYRSLDESMKVGAEEINDPSQYVAEIEKELSWMGLVNKERVGVDELAGLMQNTGIERDYMLEDLERAFAEHEAFGEGVRAGRGAQAKMECQALGYEDPVLRKSMLDRALT